MKKEVKGFTLIELLIVIVIIAIIAAIALPAYQGYAVRAKRADAKQALLTVQLLQEKWRASNTTYGSNTQLGLASPYVTDHYNTLVSGNTATGYTVTATPTGTQLTLDTECANFITNQSNSETVSTGNHATCWNR